MKCPNKPKQGPIEVSLHLCAHIAQDPVRLGLRPQPGRLGFNLDKLGLFVVQCNNLEQIHPHCRQQYRRFAPTLAANGHSLTPWWRLGGRGVDQRCLRCSAQLQVSGRSFVSMALNCVLALNRLIALLKRR